MVLDDNYKLHISKDKKLSKTLTMYRFGNHILAIEGGRGKNHGCLEKPGYALTAVLFLIKCSLFMDLRQELNTKVNHICQEMAKQSNEGKLEYISGEGKETALSAVLACHKRQHRL